MIESKFAHGHHEQHAPRGIVGALKVEEDGEKEEESFPEGGGKDRDCFQYDTM